MRKMKIILFVSFLLTVNFVPLISAHVPYIEYRDYDEDKPFFIWKMIEYSKAFYSWLENDGVNPCQDIDAFKFEIKDKPKNVYIELIVPVVDTYYKEFVPWFALVGPGLPQPNQTLPFTLPLDCGAIVMENVEPGSERETFYEPFGGKSYYDGPILNQIISQPGTYYIYCWDPYEKGGDYVMVIGSGEFFGPIDIIRSIVNTFIIRRDGELHITKNIVIDK